MIPQRMPPPPDAIGWTPNALGALAANLVQNFTAVSGSTPPNIDGNTYLAAGVGIVVLRRRFTPAEILDPLATLYTLATATNGASVTPIMACTKSSNPSGSAYSTTQSLTLRFLSGTVDMLTIGGMANSAVTINRVLVAPVATATAASGATALTIASSGIVVRNTSTLTYLGVPGTDSANYVEIAVTCLVSLV